MKFFATSLSLAFLMVFPSIAYAECYCACINNKETKVCENTWDANYVYCSGTYCSASLELDLNEEKFGSELAMSLPTGKVKSLLTVN